MPPQVHKTAAGGGLAADVALVPVQGEEVDVRIKWPNDVYGQGVKLGGVLCQSAYREGRFQVVVGVGLNLANAQPTTCVDALIRARHQQLGLPGAPGPVPREASAWPPPSALAGVAAMPFACARY